MVTYDPMLQTHRSGTISLKNEAQLAAMSAAGRLSAECLAWVVAQVVPGMTTQDLDDLVVAFAKRRGASPAPLGYRGFPRSVCTSINEVICHGIPDRKAVLRAGDIVGIDVALIVDGFHGDNAATVAVGAIAEPARKLLCATLEAQRLAIAAVRPGARLGDIGHAIQSHVEPLGFSVVRDFVGHGVGRRFHEDPQVLHYGEPGTGARLRAGPHLHDRADDQRGRPRDRDPGRRLDREDRRPQPVRAVRAHARGDARRRARAHRAERDRRVGAARRLLAAGVRGVELGHAG
jgi:methionyl aminopeptidase